MPGLNHFFCARLVRASEANSVWWKRVESVQHATRVVQSLGDEWDQPEMAWLVLAGHGTHASLWWGPGQIQLTGNPADEGKCDSRGDKASDKGTWNRAHPDVTRALETPWGKAYGKYPNWKGVQDATRAFFAALTTVAPGAMPVFLDSCLNGRLRRDHDDINMVSLVSYLLQGSEVCGSTTYLDEGMVRMLPRGEFVTDPTQLRFELENDDGVNRMLCRQFPEGIRRFDYEHRAACELSGKRGKAWDRKAVVCTRRPRNAIEKSACQHEELKQCMDWCDQEEGCKAFVWFEKNRVNNCEIHFKKCVLLEAKYGQAFLGQDDGSLFWAP